LPRQLRPQARAVIRQRGYLTRRRLGQPLPSRGAGWCVFFHNGCVPHQAGAAEADRCRSKPAVCSLFSLQQDDNDRWYVRQKVYKGGRWGPSCLDPARAARLAAEAPGDELGLAGAFQGAAQAPAQASAGGRPCGSAPWPCRHAAGGRRTAVL
jgi:hypothetical protein